MEEAAVPFKTAGSARQKAEALKRQIAARAAKDAAMRRLMSVPGVGPLTAYAYAATVDDPARFKKARQLGGYLGLTPKRFQSGETDIASRARRTSRWAQPRPATVCCAAFCTRPPPA